MKLLIDMNLSPDWVDFLESRGWPSVHWSRIGDHDAPDDLIMQWAAEHEYVVFTHDLDFGAILALTQASGPSVIQIRVEDVSPRGMGTHALSTLESCAAELSEGALVVVEPHRRRVRILPL
ncbi:MAG: DUF5615 family PIN-like protein [bacterium]|nr:DUF5615 family PIN-like protein [bacterium]MDE0600441.1 DUF5615 family PIN-like protein [bacterium]